MPRVLIVGAGLTGSTAACVLARAGAECLVLEADRTSGGLIRSAEMEGVLYEPHGSHIFHTEHAWIWDFVTSHVPFNDYRHRVDIIAAGEVYNWPLLIKDIARQPDGERIREELEHRRDVSPDRRADAANFEEWCLDLMGPTLYERFVRPYTRKQWGREPRELTASWAPRRVAVRWDDNPYLFLDAHQGWPAGGRGYTDLIEALLRHRNIELRLDSALTLRELASTLQRLACDAVLLTCPLDDFCEQRLGALEWRGTLVRSVFVPHVELAQGAMVVNYPGLEFPFIRIHETKHASGQQCSGTVLGFEFTGASARHYPVESPENIALNERYKTLISGALGDTRAHFAGRLADYRYLNMDECIARAHSVASSILSSL